ncbi:ras GTPase-activating protein 1 isoform X4 [Homalodisca vitripennis]|uniref:ras GTPase-activating protein 1 isoform X3 n=1 Tax=Homalodisca vitripennis TaxID=197043 RepID=UPI001EEA5E37|nr:ras GTPase-activating protein 1 isoform X3 [Homalodisca vitripennis]XP_046678396.1 ras GTPase-activating protein 1 isoform X4 [Homalodisca vitripennis]
MAEFIRGGSGVIIQKEKLHGSPSTGSDEGHDGATGEDFDPFSGDQDEGDGSNNSMLVAPPETQWYHGRLDRYTAEERLWEASRMGSYLVRESDRKPGSYVLSYLGRTGINHFRITAVCGDFYIGGRQFDSLPDLIGYYTSCSDLLKRERLIHPVAPPEPVNDKKRIVAILPYTKMPDTDELSFQKGDIFFVHNDMGDGWLWVTAHRTGEQGMIFRDLVDDLDENIDPNTVFNWFHPNVTKSEAVDMLVKSGPGSFLVRPSDNSPGDYSLFFHINNQIQRFRIEKKGVRYLMGGRTFECLDAVINRYRKEQIVEGHTLVQPTLNDSEAPVKPKEVQHAEKIYATLRECREQSGIKKTRGIKMQGYLCKKSEKNKKWKSLYFVLNVDETDTHLCFYDNPKRTKPKGLIDLSCAYLYQVHDSVFDRPNCFQLVERALPCLATITYLSANTSDCAQDWINALKPLCVTQMTRSPKVQRLRELRCLQLNIIDAHRLPSKVVPNPFCILSLNQVKVARTKVKTGPDPVWDEEFILDDVPPDVLTFTVTVYNKGKRSKDTEVAELTVELSSLTNGDEIEDWYSLSGMTPIGEWGSLRLRTRYLHDLIMPKEEYSPMQQLILDPSLEAVRALADLCHLDRMPLATSLLRIFRHERKEADLLKTLNDAEIEKEEETSTLFRAASLTTTLMDLYMKSVCTDFLHSALRSTIVKLLETKQSCELNPNKMESPEDACNNAEFLLQVLDEVTHSIFLSAEACPKTVRYICGCLQRCVVGKWPHERLVRTRVVSGFIFLRLLCPAILNPRQFNLISEPPPPMASRSLIMVAKCLQNLANLVEFGGKEPYMEVVNPFILKNKERMVVFLDQLSNLVEKPESEGERVKGDPARDLGTLHHICVSHLKELQALSKTQTSLKKLVTVTEMLSKHKQKYMEMIR